MDFIERWLGLSPDGGDGSTEALFLFAAVAVLIAVGFYYRDRLRGVFSGRGRR